MEIFCLLYFKDVPPDIYFRMDYSWWLLKKKDIQYAYVTNISKTCSKRVNLNRIVAIPKNNLQFMKLKVIKDISFP